MSAPVLCVVCHTHEVVPRYRPFCSERCRLVDLGRWLGGAYRVAGEPATPDAPPGDGDAAPHDAADH